MMNTKLFSAALLASAAFTLAPTADASLLVGWHDFDGVANSESPDYVASGFSGTTLEGTFSVSNGGSNDGYYGSSSIPVPTNNGYARIWENKPFTFSLTNNSGLAVPLGTLFFDAASLDSSQVLTVTYQIGANSASLLGKTTTPIAASGAGGASVNYSDFAFSLIGVGLLNIGETITFFVDYANYDGARIDNIAITAIPEPAGLLALACLLGSGLMLRSRPRMAAVAATA